MSVFKLVSSLYGMVEDTRVTTEPRDQRTRGPEDQRTKGPEDQKIRGPEDPRTGKKKTIIKNIRITLHIDLGFGGGPKYKRGQKLL